MLTFPLPHLTRVPMKATLVEEEWAPFDLKTGAVFFVHGSVSPVKLLSSMVRSTDSKSRRSAGTLSPTFNRTISPGTSSLARNVSGVPSRRLGKKQTKQLTTRNQKKPNRQLPMARRRN